MATEYFERLISLPVGENSFFLFGPRQTGKTTLVRKLLSSVDHFDIDLLETDSYLRYGRDPSQFRREVELWAEGVRRGSVVLIDEVQKVPSLLDEVHRLIELLKNHVTFIMTGSSARKLKHASTNLLAGRAWSFSLFPLTHPELARLFVLDDVLRYGSLPPIVGGSHRFKVRTLDAYTKTYLKEEVLQEALVRNMPAFARFMELAADQSGLLVNYSNMAAETGVASKTIRQYYELLEDTLVAFRLQPYVRSARKRLTMHPIYYLFDMGVINSLCGRLESSPIRGTSLYGRLFEHFVVLELHRLIQYHEKGWPLHYWRTAHGAEVDVVLERGRGRLAIEIKSGASIRPQDLGSLRGFLEDYPGSEGICVCNATRPYRIGKIRCLPWREFFDELFG